MSGYTSLCAKSSTFQFYECYDGSHLIPDSNEDPDIEIGNPREQSTRKTREANQFQYSLKTAANPREKSHYMGETIAVIDKPYLIRYNSKDFEYISNAPQNTESLTSPKQLISLEVDLSISSINQKHQRLATIYERLGNLSFAKPKLLSRSGLTPRYLFNIDPLTFPVYSHGKPHRRPWCNKTRNIPRQYKIKPSTKSGEIIRIDQIFILTVVLSKPTKVSQRW